MQYTKETLIEALQSFAEDDSEEYVERIEDIIKLGEARLAKRMDLEVLDSIDEDVVTAADSSEVTKPDNLVVDRLIFVRHDGRNTPVLRRSRAWVERYNIDGETGTPLYYCDLDEERWMVAPVAAQEFSLAVHGLYSPASIIDGADDGTTWFSTRVPELLLLACQIDAYEFLKFWSKKASAEADFEAQCAAFLKIAGALQRSDSEDIVGNRQNVNKPDTQAG